MAEPISVRMNRLCCRICCQVLRNPATLLCGHSFCMQCIQGRLNHDERSNCPYSCPECGHKFPTRPQLIKDTTLADLVRDAERCDAGSEKRKRHHSGESMQAPKRDLCWRHSSSLHSQCHKTKQIMCISIQHTLKEELKNMLVKSKQILQEQEQKRRNLGKTLEQIQEEARKTQDYCESVLVGIIDSLQRHYLSVRELIGAQEEAAAAQVQISLQTLKVKMEDMRKRNAELERLAQTDSDVDFLERWPSLQRLCEKDHLHEVSEDPLLPFEFTKRAVEQLGRQLEEFCDKEFASISQTADSGEQQESGGETEEDDTQQRCEATTSQSHGLPEVNDTVIELNEEPKTRAEFLKYACGLSLDPATAHENLAISDGDREVKLSPHQCKSPASRYPERFLQRRQVLCREGLQAERCYYEIEVKGGKAEIALAYKGIDRKSRTALSAFGGNAKSWSLDCSRNYSVSHRADSIKLTTLPSHHRIGVYLKFKEGTLSFYEVSDSMKFLYKVEAEFTEPLYPGFWLEEKCCIRICDLRRDGL
ncbi:tripartite motif-containing protein 16-like protein [Enoplosus armatus]|uniref:tripartite motif-containing protein 16-like protein n=1 Tax=Enoplosus armatus TaxID=215367 RepID=UPI003992D5B3